VNNFWLGRESGTRQHDTLEGRWDEPEVCRQCESTNTYIWRDGELLLRASALDPARK